MFHFLLFGGVGVLFVALLPVLGFMEPAQALTWAAIVPYLLVFVGVFLRTFLPFWRAALFYMRDNGDWPKFTKKFWIPPLAMILIDITGLALGWLYDPKVLQGIDNLHWTLLIIIGIGGQETLREIQRWFEQKPAENPQL